MLILSLSLLASGDRARNTWSRSFRLRIRSLLLPNRSSSEAVAALINLLLRVNGTTTLVRLTHSTTPWLALVAMAGSMRLLTVAEKRNFPLFLGCFSMIDANIFNTVKHMFKEGDSEYQHVQMRMELACLLLNNPEREDHDPTHVRARVAPEVGHEPAKAETRQVHHVS